MRGAKSVRVAALVQCGVTDTSGAWPKVASMIPTEVAPEKSPACGLPRRWPLPFSMCGR